MSRHSQQGSALLIVLGFLSFMVVSAVAFAIWMRTERVPSSAIRRTVANRYLVKAALAQAMSRVDDAVRSHVFPGVCCTSDQTEMYRDSNGSAYDWWESRVFMPPNPTPEDGGPTKPGDPPSRFAPADKTVSVLNLEALGYLPPAIANDVRLLSRSSWAAKWDYFNFDAGRYAFCAVNVSDFLDINKIAADMPRTSAAASRFSLAYLFRRGENNFSSVSGHDKFDELVHKGGRDWSEVPLVSLMDYNLALGETLLGDVPMWSPFYQYVSGYTKGSFYGASGREGARRQPFVTESWFPSSAYMKSDGTPNTPLDLSQNQPFKAGSMHLGNANFESVADAVENNFWTTLMTNGKAFSFLDMFSLFDYLDEDNVPVSLAFPCVERVPMIAALAPPPSGDNGITVAFTSFEPAEQPTKSGEGGDEIKVSQIRMKVTAGGGLSSVLVFPFKGAPKPDDYKVQAFGRLVFVAETQGDDGTAKPPAVSLRHRDFARNLRPMNEAEWTGVAEDNQFKLEAGGGQGKLERTPAENCLAVTLTTNPETWTRNGDIKSVPDCWRDGGKTLGFNVNFKEKGYPIIQKNEYYKRESREGGREEVASTPYKTTYQILLCPFGTDGNVIDDVASKEYEEAEFVEYCAKYTLRPYLVTWARVLQQDGRTVDMVPATYEDDMAFNAIDNNQQGMLPNSVMIEQLNVSLGNFPIKTSDGEDPNGRLKMPILRFPGRMMSIYTEALKKAKGNDLNPIAVDWEVKACYAVDPRFNWAPENWWFETAGTLSGENWLNAVFRDGGILDELVKGEYVGEVLRRGDRANDPFLFVSNLGYLQSVGELAFLPRLTFMRENGYTMESYAMGDTIIKELKDALNIDKKITEKTVYNGDPRDINSAGSVKYPMPCAFAAWKSYQNYRTNPKKEVSGFNPEREAFEFGANLYRRGLVNGTQDFYVNPYTQSQEIMLAALANTPLNYWVAGTNYTVQGKSQMSTFNDYKNSMFCDSGNGVRFTGQDINKVAAFLRRRFEDVAAMVSVRDSTKIASAQDFQYAYQKVWEDMFDALDWSGTVGCSVEDVYDSLDYYYSTESTFQNYRLQYMQEGGSGYSGLNHYARGGGKRNFANIGIKIDKKKAVHKEDIKSLGGRETMADPLRAQHEAGGDTDCWQNFCDVDRMFLHSYWRDCFANRQQLFLIFVRAESTALGGSGEGTPAQQGGRAVALVWRDPFPTLVTTDRVDGEEPEDENRSGFQPNRRPHKMRVLFYRQFD